MLVNQNHFRKYNMHWVSPKAFGAQKINYEDAAAKNNIKQQHLPPQGPNLGLISGDHAAETPSQSNFDIDNYIVSVQNTR